MTKEQINLLKEFKTELSTSLNFYEKSVKQFNKNAEQKGLDFHDKLYWKNELEYCNTKIKTLKEKIRIIDEMLRDA